MNTTEGEVAGICDEISIVIAPVADGSIKTPTLFSEKEGITTDKPVGFELKNADIKEGETVWLRLLIFSLTL